MPLGQAVRYRILQQLGMLDGEGRARPDAFEKIRLLPRGQRGLLKTRLAVDALTLIGGPESQEES